MNASDIFYILIVGISEALTLLLIYVIINKSTDELKIYKFALLKLASCIFLFCFAISILVSPDLLCPLPAAIVRSPIGGISQNWAFYMILISIITATSVFISINDCCLLRATIFYQWKNVLRNIQTKITFFIWFFLIFIISSIFQSSLAIDSGFNISINTSNYIENNTNLYLYIDVSWVSNILPIVLTFFVGLHVSNFLSMRTVWKSIMKRKNIMSLKSFSSHTSLTLFAWFQNIYPIVCMVIPILIVLFSFFMNYESDRFACFIKHFVMFATVIYPTISVVSRFAKTSMSRPITILNKPHGNEQLGSPGDSLGRSAGALRIVENVCGSPVTSFGSRLMAYNSKNDGYPESPEFHLHSFINQGGRVIGQNVNYAFGTPPCQCINAEPIVNTHWSNFDHLSCASNNVAYVNQNIASNIENMHNMQSFFGTSTGATNFDFFNERQHHPPKSSLVSPTSTITPALSPTISLIQQPLTSVPVIDNLLQKYRANPSAMKSLKLSEVRGNLLVFAKDQVGSRFIQQKLENSDICEKDAIFDEVIEHADELVDDIFGNYVVQKFFEYGEYKHWVRLVDAIIARVPEHAFQMYACRVLQKALEKVNEPLQIQILSQVQDIILECMKDQNGNHVIQKAVEKVSPQHIQFIIDILLAHPDTVFEMAVDPYGCRVVQRCLEYCVKEQTRPIIARIHERFDDIVNNQYGNYVVQHVIQHGCEVDKVMIIRKVASNLFEYAIHKFSSNVIEKCLEQGTIQQKGLLVKSACRLVDRNQPVVVQMMKDQYANYVVQKMFDQVTSDQRRELTIAIKPHIPILKQLSYGKHILAKLEKYFQKPVAFMC